jgi:uncharacterized protein YndB with AHSA1/START domain
MSTTPEKLWGRFDQRRVYPAVLVREERGVGLDSRIRGDDNDPWRRHRSQGKVLAAEVNKRLSYTWGSGTSTDNTPVVIEITQIGLLGKLLITHDIDLSESGGQQAGQRLDLYCVQPEDVPRDREAHAGHLLEEIVSFPRDGEQQNHCGPRESL